MQRFFPQYISNTKIMGYWTIINAIAMILNRLNILYIISVCSGERDSMLSSIEESRLDISFRRDVKLRLLQTQ